MARLTEEALAATRGLARSLLAEALGVTPRCPRVSVQALTHDTRRRWTQETIVDAVESFAKKHDRLPTREEWQHAKYWELPAFDTIRRYWGSRVELHQAMYLRRQLQQALARREETP